MSTLDSLGDFYLPGPAARDDEPEPEAFPLDDYESVDAASDTGADETEPLAAPRQRLDERHGAEAETTPAAADTAIGRRGGRGNLAIALLLLAGMAATGAYLAQPQTLPIKRVNIEGEFVQLSRGELQQLVTGELHGGFFSMDVAALRDAVTASPWVRDVSVQRVWPDTLQVSVREQTAVARWRDSGLVNSQGHYFQPDMSTAPADLPLLQGPAETQAQLTRRLQQLQEAVAPLDMRVSTLSLSERRAWSFMTASGLEVVLGRENFDKRLERFTDLVPASLGERLGQASYIDMRYTNGFAVRFQAENTGPPAKGPNKGNGAA